MLLLGIFMRFVLQTQRPWPSGFWSPSRGKRVFVAHTHFSYNFRFQIVDLKSLWMTPALGGFKKAVTFVLLQPAPPCLTSQKYEEDWDYPIWKG
jgi:hypothetical protein